MDSKITHIIFDVDGLIIDTERVYSECLSELCSAYGHEFTWEVKVKQMGMKERDSGQYLIDALKLPITVDEYLSILKGKLEEKLPTTQLMPGADRLIRHLHSHNIPMALATGSDGWGFSRKTSNHKELFSLFSHVVLSSDDPEVKAGKPAPDCFLVCAKRFKDIPNPAQTLVFEDAPNGAEAGLAAGMKVVWVPDPRADTSDLGQRVTEVLETLEKFSPERYGLPAYS